MIKICSFYSLPIEEQRIGRVYSIANSRPRNVKGIAGTIQCFVPPWDIVEAYKNREINEEEYTVAYRRSIVERWSQVKRWLDHLEASGELYLCCWEKTGFCHRYLVARLIQKFRPDLEMRVT